jgi:hypothetical protein
LHQIIVSGLRRTVLWKSPRNLNNTGVSIVLNSTSKRKDNVNGLYATTDDGYRNEMNQSNNALIIVAQKPSKAGIKKPSVFNVLLNIPPMNPNMVRKRQFNPNGQALRKSRKTPEIKPVDSPINLPFSIEK